MGDGTDFRESVGNLGMYLKGNQRQQEKANMGGIGCKDNYSLRGNYNEVSDSPVTTL